MEKKKIGKCLSVKRKCPVPRPKNPFMIFFHEVYHDVVAREKRKLEQEREERIQRSKVKLEDIYSVEEEALKERVA